MVDPATGQVTGTLVLPPGTKAFGINLAFLPGGGGVVAATSDGKVVLFGLDGRLVRTIGSVGGQNCVIHNAENATARPSTTSTRPALRCHLGWRRRSADENWKAPRTAYSTAQTMCTTTGAGEAVTPGFAGITCGPPATSIKRKEPLIAGTRTRATSANGTHPGDRVDRVGRAVGRTVT